MRTEDILTLQSAVELDRIHNEGRLLKALKGEHITKEEFIASIFNIVQKKNAQQETQKLLSNIANTQNDIFTDYWDKKELSWKEKIYNKLFFDREGEINFENIKYAGIGALVLITTIAISSRYLLKSIKRRFGLLSIKISDELKNKTSKSLRNNHTLINIKEYYTKRLAVINRILQFDNLSVDDREKYTIERGKVEKLLNNDDNSVGGIVEENPSVNC